MNLELVSRRFGDHHVEARAFDEGILIRWMDGEALGSPRVLGQWTVADTWQTLDPPDDADVWVAEVRDAILTDGLKHKFWEALQDIWLQELPDLRATAEAPGATEEDRETVRRGTVYLALAANGLGQPVSALGQAIAELSEGWTGTGAEFVDAAALLLRDDGTPAAT